MSDQKPSAQKPENSPPHPGMMGDGTEEQNLDQTGNPAARITEEEVKEVFQKSEDVAKNKK